MATMKKLARAGICAWIAVLGTGCAGSTRLLEPLTGGTGQRLTPADFRATSSDPAAPLTQAAPRPMLDPAAPPAGSLVPANPNAAVRPATPQPLEPMSVEAIAGGPDLSGAAPDPVESAALLDIKIGDINGRPIFASEFFKEMEERLVAESRLMTRRAWTESATNRINEKLGTIIAGELLRAEALETLPVQTREVGVSRLLDRERSAIQSRAGGSLAEAQRRLMEERGLTLEEYLSEFRDASLANLSIEQIRNAVQVSGRDIRNYYDRHYDEYNPKPRARLRQITILSSSTDARTQIEAALAEGTPFEQVASRPPNTFNRTTGGLVEVDFEGEFSQANLLVAQSLNDAARGLTPGQWVGPIQYGDNGVLSAWLFLERVDRTSRSLYEAQIEIARKVRDIETERRFRETIERLRERASFTSQGAMAQRLLQIALARYYPPTQPEPTNPSPAPAR